MCEERTFSMEPAAHKIGKIKSRTFYSKLINEIVLYMKKYWLIKAYIQQRYNNALKNVEVFKTKLKLKLQTFIVRSFHVGTTKFLQIQLEL